MKDIRVSALVLIHPQRPEILMVRKAGTTSFMLPGGKP
ncbi:DNA mismatch repair protein MutT, partial [Burkholderia multivorans]